MLNRYRQEHNLTQQQMADLLNISVSSYNLYENHKREMTFDTTIKFLKMRNATHDKEFIEMLESLKKHV